MSPVPLTSVLREVRREMETILGEWPEAVDGLGSRAGAGQRAVAAVLLQRVATVVSRAFESSRAFMGS